MGLFSNNKKLCPICGNPTPRLLPTKFDGQPICKQCDGKLDLPNEVQRGMTLGDFRDYLALYEENRPLREQFTETHRYGGFRSDSLYLDEEHGLIRLRGDEKCWAIEKKYLRSFRILEDDRPLFESGNGALNCYYSDVADRAEQLRPLVSQFYFEKREFEHREAMERARHRGEDFDERMERERVNNLYRPRFRDTNLFKGFRLEISFDHPYWTAYSHWDNAPELDDDNPSVDDFQRDYSKAADELYALAVKLMQMIDPSAGVKQIGFGDAAAANTATSADAVAEIKKYKELLDSKLISEEEFAAKKRQLLGI